MAGLYTDSSQLIQLREVTRPSNSAVIGRGSYGRVIKVYVHGMLCAAKEVHANLVEGVTPAEFEVMKQLFLSECVKSSRIHHPKVVQVLGIHYPSPEAKLPWLVMEMMECSVKGFLESYKRDKIPLHFKLSILVDVSQGLEFLHGQDIIHRDLSSNNVLLTKHFVAKIGDFGVAKVVTEHNKMKTQTQTPGTLHFMPPEAVSRKPHYNKPVDVFSLACITLHVMSHEWPEPKDRVREDSMTALTEVERREDYLLFCTHSSLKHLVESCLHNKPEKRPLISAVRKQFMDFKATVDQQVPFATANTIELFDAVRQGKVENIKLTNTVAQMEATITENSKTMQQKDKQILEKDNEVQKIHREMQEKGTEFQEKCKELQEKVQNKDKEIQNLHMLIPVTATNNQVCHFTHYNYQQVVNHDSGTTKK